MSPTDTKRRLFICFSQLGKKVTKMCFSKGGIRWRFVIKICLIKRSTEAIWTQWQNFLQDPLNPYGIWQRGPCPNTTMRRTTMILMGDSSGLLQLATVWFIDTMTWTTVVNAPIRQLPTSSTSLLPALPASDSMALFRASCSFEQVWDYVGH